MCASVCVCVCVCWMRREFFPGWLGGCPERHTRRERERETHTLLGVEGCPGPFPPLRLPIHPRPLGGFNFSWLHDEHFKTISCASRRMLHPYWVVLSLRKVRISLGLYFSSNSRSFFLAKCLLLTTNFFIRIYNFEVIHFGGNISKITEIRWGVR